MIIVSEELLELIEWQTGFLFLKSGEITGEIERSRNLTEDHLVQQMI